MSSDVGSPIAFWRWSNCPGGGGGRGSLAAAGAHPSAHHDLANGRLCLRVVVLHSLGAVDLRGVDLRIPLHPAAAGAATGSRASADVPALPRRGAGCGAGRAAHLDHAGPPGVDLFVKGEDELAPRLQRPDALVGPDLAPNVALQQRLSTHGHAQPGGREADLHLARRRPLGNGHVYRRLGQCLRPPVVGAHPTVSDGDCGALLRQGPRERRIAGGERDGPCFPSSVYRTAAGAPLAADTPALGLNGGDAGRGARAGAGAGAADAAPADDGGWPFADGFGPPAAGFEGFPPWPSLGRRWRFMGNAWKARRSCSRAGAGGASAAAQPQPLAARRRTMSSAFPSGNPIDAPCGGCTT